MNRILVIFGTRPEAIKMVPVVDALRRYTKLETKVCITAQHRNMLDQVMKSFGMASDFDLNSMRAAQDLTHITNAVLTGIRDVLQQWQPHLVVVHGDTTTTFAASLAAFYARVAVAHVEAGLRTNDMYVPWPEEMNRRLTSSLATLHFAPTEAARGNLIREGIASETIWVTGNTVVDALLQTLSRIDGDAAVKERLDKQFADLDARKNLILVTGHRRESFGNGLENICLALKHLSERTDVEIVYPVHSNPSVREPVNRILAGCPNVYLLGPLEYEPFVYLMNRSYMILTDSGGIQEEAPSLGKPVLVLRDATERPEGIDTAAARLVGTLTHRIIAEAASLLDDPFEYRRMSHVQNPYGTGDAAQRIAAVIATFAAAGFTIQPNHWAIVRASLSQ